VKDIERMVVSAHLDGEVEAPWKDQVEAKLASDPAWAAEAQRHLRVKEALASAPEPDFSQAQDRIRARIAAHTPGVRRTPAPQWPLAWVSVAAAALVLLAAGGGFWAGRLGAPVPGVSVPSEVAELKVEAPKALGLKLSGEGQLLMASTLEGPHR